MYKRFAAVSPPTSLVSPPTTLVSPSSSIPSSCVGDGICGIERSLSPEAAAFCYENVRKVILILWKF